MTADLHCHTKVSDGSMGIDDLIVLAQAQGVQTISITDHDCQAGNIRGKIIGERRDVTVIPGVELSAYSASFQTEVHLLCYHTESPDRLEGLCHKNITARKRASQYMVLKVAQRYPITTELVLKCASGSTSVYTAHIMHALMECGLADSIHGELYRELFHPDSPGNVFVQPKFAEPAEVIAAIHEAGGIAVLSHPGQRISFDCMDMLCQAGLDGIEVWSPAHDEQTLSALQDYASHKQLLMTGGSDFHGMYGDRVTLGSCVTPAEQMRALSARKTLIRKQNRG